MANEDFDREQKRYDNLCPTDYGYVEYGEVEHDEKLDYEDEDERHFFDESWNEFKNDRFENESINEAQNNWEKNNKL